MKFSIINRDTVYRSRAFEIQKVQLRLPNSKERAYDLVAHKKSVTVVPLDDEGNVWFVIQYRLGAEAELLELPAGVLDADEDPRSGAMRETREEIGMACSELKLLGDFYLAPGYSSEHMYVFLATGLFPSALDQDDDEFITVQKIPLAEVLRMVNDQEIHDGKSLAALMLAFPPSPAS